MKRKRFLGCLLAMMISTSMFITTTIKAHAEDDYGIQFISHKNSQVSEIKVIDKLVMEGLNELVEGEKLDSSIRVKADNFIWKIPVIWVNETGDIVEICPKDKKVFPVFALVVPKGYVFEPKSGLMNSITLSGVATEIFKGRHIVTIADQTTGIIFISCFQGPEIDAYLEQIKKNENNEKASALGTVVEYPRMPSEWPSEWQSESLANKDKYISDTEKVTGEKLVEMHCDKNVIENVDADKLAALVELVRYDIQPRAVSLLLNGFKCFETALENKELSDRIGLYVYYNQALFKKSGVWEYRDWNSAAAYASRRFESGIMYESIALNIGNSYINDGYVFNTETGAWELNDSAKNYLANNIAHEMLHAFMYDYTGAGMLGSRRTENGWDNDANIAFPKWFLEGIATTINSPYQYYNTSVKAYAKDADAGRYTAEDFKANYSNREELQLVYGEMRTEQNGTNIRSYVYSTYLSGYLACMYLGYLASENDIYRDKYGINGHAKETIVDGSYIINNDVIAQGLSTILSEIHGHGMEDGTWSAKSLDEVIDELIEGPYTTEKFQADFITNLDGSAEFCADLLQYFEDASVDGQIANGSVLLPANSTQKNILEDVEPTKPLAYMIPNREDFEVGIPQYEKSESKNNHLDGGKTNTLYGESSDEEAIISQSTAASPDMTEQLEQEVNTGAEESTDEEVIIEAEENIEAEEDINISDEDIEPDTVED